MRKLLFSLDDALYWTNQKGYDWLHDRYDLYVATYRMIFLWVSMIGLITADFIKYMEDGYKFRFLLSTFLLLAASNIWSKNFKKEYELQRKGHYVQLNLLANICHSFDKHFYMRCVFNVLDGIDIVYSFLEKNFSLGTAATLITMVWLYSLMVLVKPRNTQKRKAPFGKFAPQAG